MENVRVGFELVDHFLQHIHFHLAGPKNEMAILQKRVDLNRDHDHHL